MSKPKIPPNMIIAKVSQHIWNAGFPKVGEGGWVGGMEEGVSAPSLYSQILLIPPCNGLHPPLLADPSYILKYAPHTTWVNLPISGFPFPAP